MNFSWRDSSLDASLAELRKPETFAVVFGAGRAGELTVKACIEAGVKLAAVCDNSPAKSGTAIDGVPVIAPAAALGRHPQAKIIMAVLNDCTVDVLLGQLEEMGIRECFGAQLTERFFRFPEPPTYRNGGWTTWALAKECGVAHRNYAPGGERVNISAASHLITDRCSLNCRDCSVFVPHFKRPRHYPLAEVAADIDALCSATDSIRFFGVLGGEALLHPEFHAIVRHAANRPEIDRVVVTTNGTLLPREEQWEDLRHPKVFFRLSNYGELSRNRDRLVARLEKEGIKGEVLWDQSHWVESPLVPNGGGKSVEELRRVFKACLWNDCLVVAGRKLYRCGSQLNGIKLGVIPEPADDSVDLSIAADPERLPEVRRAVRRYVYHQEYLHACGYCRGRGDACPKAVPAIQAERLAM